MYKVIIDDEEVLSTDDTSEFITYCLDNYHAREMLVMFLEDKKDFSIILSTAG